MCSLCYILTLRHCVEHDIESVIMHLYLSVSDYSQKLWTCCTLRSSGSSMMSLICCDTDTSTQWYLAFAASGNKDNDITGTSWRHTKKLTRLFWGFLNVSWRQLHNLHYSSILSYLTESSRVSCLVNQNFSKAHSEWLFLLLCHTTILFICWSSVALSGVVVEKLYMLCATITCTNSLAMEERPHELGDFKGVGHFEDKF